MCSLNIHDQQTIIVVLDYLVCQNRLYILHNSLDTILALDGMEWRILLGIDTPRSSHEYNINTTTLIFANFLSPFCAADFHRKHSHYSNYHLEQMVLE